MNDDTEPKWIRMVEALSKSRVEFKRDVARLMYVPVVYVVFGKDLVLYVGMSTRGIARVFNRNHHAMKQDIWRDVQSVQVFEVDSEAAARTLEACLIREFKPIHNDRLDLTKRDKGSHTRKASAVIEAYGA